MAKTGGPVMPPDSIQGGGPWPLGIISNKTWPVGRPNAGGLNRLKSYTGQGVTPKFPPLKGDFSPWTGGLPPNPVPLPIPVVGQNTDNGQHLGWTRGIGNLRKSGIPIPVTIPSRFRVPPPETPMGARPPKLGNFHVPADLHASVLPSNPMVFTTIDQAQQGTQAFLDSTPGLRAQYSMASNTIKNIIGRINGSR